MRRHSNQKSPGLINTLTLFLVGGPFKWFVILVITISVLILGFSFFSFMSSFLNQPTLGKVPLWAMITLFGLLIYYKSYLNSRVIQ